MSRQNEDSLDDILQSTAAQGTGSVEDSLKSIRSIVTEFDELATKWQIWKLFCSTKAKNAKLRAKYAEALNLIGQLQLCLDSRRMGLSRQTMMLNAKITQCSDAQVAATLCNVQKLNEVMEGCIRTFLYGPIQAWKQGVLDALVIRCVNAAPADIEAFTSCNQQFIAEIDSLRDQWQAYETEYKQLTSKSGATRGGSWSRTCTGVGSSYLNS